MVGIERAMCRGMNTYLVESLRGIQMEISATSKERAMEMFALLGHGTACADKTHRVPSRAEIRREEHRR